MALSLTWLDIVVTPTRRFVRAGTRRLARKASPSAVAVSVPHAGDPLSLNHGLVFITTATMVTLSVAALLLLGPGRSLTGPCLSGLGLFGLALVTFPAFLRRLDTYLPWAPRQVDPGDVTILRSLGVLMVVQATGALACLHLGWDLVGSTSMLEWAF